MLSALSGAISLRTGWQKCLRCSTSTGEKRGIAKPTAFEFAALKLAAGSIERLRYEMEGAKCDYRDLLAAAEYPGYFKRVPGPGRSPVDEEQRIIDADWKQYQDWFAR
jgi:hypothetical protein